jgi:hypothetical protein
MNRLRRAWCACALGLLCGVAACGDSGGRDAAPAHVTPDPGAAQSGSGSGGRALGGTPSGSGGARGATHTNGNDPDSQNRADAGSGRADAGGDAPVTTGEGMAPEPPKGSACMGGRAEFDRHSAHCGACGHACAPVVIASGLDWPTDLVLDATHAYVITSGNEGKVLSIPLDGGTPATLAEHQVWPMAIAVDASNVYWAIGTVYKLPLSGGTPVSLIPTDVLTSMTITPHSLAVDGDSVYWTQPGLSNDDVATVMKVSIDGGTPVTLASVPDSDPYGIAVDRENVYWANGADSMGRRVMKVSIDGGEPITLASGSGSTFGFGIDATHAYWTAFVGTASSAVMKVPLAGGTPVMLATGTAQPMDLALDGVSVYWTNASTSQTFAGTPGTDGTVMAVPRVGGDADTLGPDQQEPGGIAANGTTVCWTNTGTGQGTGTVKCLGTCANGMCP